MRAELQRLKRDTETGRARAWVRGDRGRGCKGGGRGKEVGARAGPEIGDGGGPGEWADALEDADHGEPGSGRFRCGCGFRGRGNGVEERWQEEELVEDCGSAGVAGCRSDRWRIVAQRRNSAEARLTDKDTVVLADFANSTGDPVFDDALKQALNVALRQSPFLNCFRITKWQRRLQLMSRPAKQPSLRSWRGSFACGQAARLTSRASIAALGEPICHWAEGGELPEWRTAGAGAGYGAFAKKRCWMRWGDAASKLRGEMGESLATVQKFDVRLEQATTSSLEALKAYSLGEKAYRDQGAAAALPFR